jgi:hypothetical protein
MALPQGVDAMPNLFRRLWAGFRTGRTVSSKPSLRRSAIGVRSLEDRCLLSASGFMGPLQANATLAPSNQHRIEVVQTLLTNTQNDLTADIQEQTQSLANQLTHAQNAATHVQTLVTDTQTDITDDLQAQTNTLANIVARDQRLVDNLQADLTKAQARLTAYQQHGSSQAIANATALVQKFQDHLTAAQNQLAADQQAQQNATTPQEVINDQARLQKQQDHQTAIQNQISTIQQNQQNITNADIAHDQERIQHYQSVLQQLQG